MLCGLIYRDRYIDRERTTEKMYKKWAPLNIEKGRAEVIVLDPSDLFLNVKSCMGRKYQHDWLYLESINSGKHLPQSPFTDQFF